MFCTSNLAPLQLFFPPKLSFSAGKTAFDFGLKILKKFLSVSV